MNLYETINNLLNKPVYLIDVGAYKGEFTDNFLRNINKIEFIDMYEPQDSSFVDLGNKFLNNKNINIYNFAIGNENIQKEFFYFENEGYKSSLLKPIEGGGKMSIVEIKTLDEIYKKVENAYLKYDYFLKLDTQGNDLSVLKGAKNFIKNSQPIIFCELIYVPLYENQSYANEIINYMMENDYVLVRLEDVHETVNGFIAYADGLFVHKSKLNLDCTSFELHKDSYCLNLENVCQERLDLIIRLDGECKRLQKK